MEIVTENATSLAWIGDAIMTLKVREHILKKGIEKLIFYKRRVHVSVVQKDRLVSYQRFVKKIF